MPSDKKHDAQYFLDRGVAPREHMSPKIRASMALSWVVWSLHRLSPLLGRTFTKVLYLGHHERAYMRLYWALQSKNTDIARRYRNIAEKNGAEEAEALKSSALSAYRKGSLTSSTFEEERLLNTVRFQKLIKNVNSSRELLEEGFTFNLDKASSFEPLADHTFYLLHNSLPINSGGYATRSHGVLTGLKNQGFKASGLTRLGFPHDRGKEYADRDYKAKDSVDGVDYFRLLSAEVGLGRLPIKEYLKANITAHMPLLESERPAIIHGASNFVNGLTANALARAYNLISIYETRGLWEVTRMSREPEYKGTDAYNLYVRMETQASLEADHCFAITEALKREMIERGIPAEKITVVPNGVDTERFKPLPCDKALKHDLGFVPNDVIIGYVGSVVDYEGLDYLIESMKELERRGYHQAKVLIIGDGAVLENLKDLTKQLNLYHLITFTGRVPHEDVEKYYSIIDIAPFPRKGYPVCEMVSPLKPFEAMAMGKTVIISDVAAMTEFVEPGVTGVIVKKDDITSLTDGLVQLLDDTNFRNTLSKNALKFVRKERDWKIIAKQMADVYKMLLSRHQN